MSADQPAARSVSRIVNGVRRREGAGFIVRRPFPSGALDHFDPFLLLDELGPVTVGPGEAQGAPDHPHRGFETVTYLLAGELEHKDSQGHTGRLRPGDVQWMTAGSGVIHSEMPTAEFRNAGGRMHGFQLWVNLPRRDKMMAPRYQDIPASRIPIAWTADGGVTVRVIAGEALGARAVIDTRTPIMYLHYTLQPGARAAQQVPRNYNVFAYVVDGQPQFGADARPASDGQMVMFVSDGDEVIMHADPGAVGPANILFIGGTPLNELIARYGPFVMNTDEEIEQAIEDYRNGRMGRITA